MMMDICTGTHWMTEIVGLLLADGDIDRVNRLTNIAHIEFSILEKNALNDANQGNVKHCLMYKVRWEFFFLQYFLYLFI